MSDELPLCGHTLHTRFGTSAVMHGFASDKERHGVLLNEEDEVVVSESIAAAWSPPSAPRHRCGPCDEGTLTAGHCVDIDGGCWHECAATIAARTPAAAPEGDALRARTTVLVESAVERWSASDKAASSADYVVDALIAAGLLGGAR